MKKIFLLAALAMTMTGFAQKVTNKLSFQKGQKFEVTTVTDKNSTMEFMGQPMESKINATFTEVLDVADGSTSGATLEHKVKRLQFDMTSPMQSESFDSEKDADRKGDMGKMLEKGLKNKYTMTVDATGKITAVKADDDNPNGKKTEGADMGDLISMQLGANLGLPKVGAASSFKILPEREVGVGDTWTDTSSAEGSKTKTVYTVKSITDAEIILDFTQDVNVNTTREIMGTEATVKSNAKSTGTITLDRASGLLKQRTATVEEEGSMEAQGQSMGMKGKTTITTTVKPAQ